MSTADIAHTREERQSVSEALGRSTLHHPRGSVASMAWMSRLACIGVLLAAGAESARSKHDARNYVAPVRLQAQSVEDVVRQARYGLGDIAIQEFASARQTEPSDPGVAPVEMGREALSSLFVAGTALVASPTTAMTMLKHNANASADYLSGYQMSEKEAETADPAALDCNDHASVACQKLERLGLPMYILSIWPEEPGKRLHEDWHQMAACKLGDHTYFILDNGRGIVWEGSLDAFAAEYYDHPDKRMRIIPVVGIAKYAEPAYENWFSKMLVQARHACSNETAMESLNIPKRENRPVQLATN